MEPPKLFTYAATLKEGCYRYRDEARDLACYVVEPHSPRPSIGVTLYGRGNFWEDRFSQTERDAELYFYNYDTKSVVYTRYKADVPSLTAPPTSFLVSSSHQTAVLTEEMKSRLEATAKLLAQAKYVKELPFTPQDFRWRCAGGSWP